MIISWKIIHWKKISRKLWFKTANIVLKKGKLEDWVYKINIKINENIYFWIWVFLEKNEIFESHIFDFEEDIYWENIEINIFEKIRNNKKFDNFEELKSQINFDIKKVKEIKNYVLTFWTFDIAHLWHNFYLKNAKFYWDKLITIISTDKNVKKFKWIFPENNAKNRLKNIKKLNISDEILLWEENSPMKYIDFYKPKFICLWYDQIWFSDILKKYIEEKNLKTKIIRINSFKENIYKSSILKNK